MNLAFKTNPLTAADSDDENDNEAPNLNLDNFIQQLQQLRELTVRQRKKIKEQQKRIYELEAQEDSFRNEVENCSKVLEMSRDEITRNKEEIAYLSSQVTLYQDQVNKLTANLSQQKGMNMQMLEKMKSLKVEYHSLYECKQNDVKVRDNLEKHLEVMKNKHHDLKKQVEEVCSGYDSLVGFLEESKTKADHKHDRSAVRGDKEEIE